LPALEQRKVVPEVAEWVAAHASPSDRIAAYRLNRWSTAFRFYVDRHVETLETPDEARRFFLQSGNFYCLMLDRVYEEFVNEGVPLVPIHEREGMWATSGRVLWRRRIPPTHFVVVTRRSAQSTIEHDGQLPSEYRHPEFKANPFKFYARLRELLPAHCVPLPNHRKAF